MIKPLQDGKGNSMSLLGKRVLLVEDDQFLAEMLGDLIAAAGGVVVGPAQRVPEALALVTASALDIAILDLCLGTRRSLAVYEALRARGVPVVITTGLSGEDTCLPTEVPLLQKPYRWVELASALNNALVDSAAPAREGLLTLTQPVPADNR